jgi:hypothetical protein
MDPKIAARARRRWRAMLLFSGAATTFVVLLALWAGAVLASAAGADQTTMFAVVAVAAVVVVVLLCTVGGISWWVLRRRDALGPSLLWGADRPTRRRVAAGLREQRRLEGLDHELALSEAGRTARFGLLLPCVMFTNVTLQAGWLAFGWADAATNPLLFGTRIVAVVFFGWAGCQGLVALRRARRYLERYSATPTELVAADAG